VFVALPVTSSALMVNTPVQTGRAGGVSPLSTTEPSITTGQGADAPRSPGGDSVVVLGLGSSSNPGPASLMALAPPPSGVSGGTQVSVNQLIQQPTWSASRPSLELKFRFRSPSASERSHGLPRFEQGEEWILPSARAQAQARVGRPVRLDSVLDSLAVHTVLSRGQGQREAGSIDALAVLYAYPSAGMADAPIPTDPMLAQDRPENNKTGGALAGLTVAAFAGGL
jgi:hypothetical protein